MLTEMLTSSDRNLRFHAIDDYVKGAYGYSCFIGKLLHDIRSLLVGLDHLQVLLVDADHFNVSQDNSILFQELYERLVNLQ